METEEERRARLENDAATKRFRLTVEMEIAQLMLNLIKGVVNVGVALSLKPILKFWQLCLSFKLDVLTTLAPTTERNIDHELLSASLFLLYILLYMYLITYTL